jgi:hypothetical protein
VLISLVREHTEQMNPPRALWVPFDLGRPMGAPDEPAFQRKVLETALGLLAADSGPVLADFDEDAPGGASDDMSGWVCPVNLPAPPASGDKSDLRRALEAEMAALQPWYDLHRERKKRSIVGVDGLGIEDTVALIADFLDDPGMASPRDDRPLAQMLKFAAENMKAWYFEAAAAQPGGTSRQLADWFWNETIGGKALLQMTAAMRAADNKMLNAIGEKAIVPRSHNRLVP